MQRVYAEKKKQTWIWNAGRQRLKEEASSSRTKKGDLITEYTKFIKEKLHQHAECQCKFNTKRWTLSDYEEVARLKNNKAVGRSFAGLGIQIWCRWSVRIYASASFQNMVRWRHAPRLEAKCVPSVPQKGDPTACASQQTESCYQCGLTPPVAWHGLSLPSYVWIRCNYRDVSSAFPKFVKEAKRMGLMVLSVITRRARR